MPCGHTLCEQCVLKIYTSGVIKCPFCNARHTAKPPVNYILVALIIKFAEEQQAEQHNQQRYEAFRRTGGLPADQIHVHEPAPATSASVAQAAGPPGWMCAWCTLRNDFDSVSCAVCENVRSSNPTTKPARDEDMRRVYEQALREARDHSSLHSEYLKAGTCFYKHKQIQVIGFSKQSTVRRLVRLSTDGRRLLWFDASAGGNAEKGSLAVTDIISVESGCAHIKLERPHLGITIHCNAARPEGLQLECDTSGQKKLWIEALQAICKRAVQQNGRM
jgi:Zinc finger, C3HC4 type (RING finger)